MRNSVALCMTLVFATQAPAQDDKNIAAILERLERLEKQNRELVDEVKALRLQIASQQAAAAPPTASVDERLEVQERRTEELQESKVQASQRLPISITGLLLFNSYLNTRHSGANEFPTAASMNTVPRTGGATFRQTVLGLHFNSPTTVWGAKVNGSVYMDFFANPTGGNAERITSNNLSRLMRLRLASVELDWGSTSLTVAQDKPIISPREPVTLVQVGVSPLTGAGNLWLWQPQVRLQHQFRFDEKTDLRAQVGIFQTSEGGALVPDGFQNTLESSRPGYEGRFAFHRSLGNDGHIEFAPGFHLSTTHVAGTSVPSRVYSVDWSIAPVEKWTFTGMFYRGQNVANLGTIRQGFTIFGTRNVIPIHSIGGWGQISYAFTPRLSFNVYGGQHDDRDRDLRSGNIGKNFVYAGNALYRIAPNVTLGLELMQLRTNYVDLGRRLNNHYDLALAYQF